MPLSGPLSLILKMSLPSWVFCLDWDWPHNLTMLDSVQTLGRLGWNPQYPCYNTVKRTISVMSNLDSINLTQPTRKSNIVEITNTTLSFT
jgi:hypothetical protein